MKSSNYNVFTHNNLEQNRAHGFEIYTGTNNEIYLNNFIENYDLSAWPQGWTYNSQAVDSGLGNLWYSISSSTGNYWSNYWYIESHYAIDGDSNSSDLFPSGRNDTISPVIVEVTYSPVSPTFEEDITISANAYDNAGILRVEVHYRLGDGEIQIEELNLFHYSGIVGYFDIEIGPFAKNATINFSIVVEDYFENSVESEMYTFTIQTDEEEVTVNFSNFLVISVALATFTTFQTYQKLKRRT